MKQKYIRLEDKKFLDLNIYLAKNSLSFQKFVENYIDDVLEFDNKKNLKEVEK